MSDEINLDVKYNAIIFIESLRPSEAQTTHGIFKNLVKPHCLKNKIGCQYHHVTNKTQFLSILKKIHKNEKRIFPIIHIACHGDQEGIKLLDSTVSWEECSTQIEKINKRSKNHLYLIMAMCYGAFSVSFNALSSRAPYYSC